MDQFKQALDMHLKSIADRDIAAFSEFLHPSHSSMVILPNGHMLKSNEDIIDFHIEWFADLDWRMDVKIMDILDMGSVGYALCDVIYHDIDEDGKPYQMEYFLSLLFNKIEGKWVLIRDQNTLK